MNIRLCRLAVLLLALAGPLFAAAPTPAVPTGSISGHIFLLDLRPRGPASLDGATLELQPLGEGPTLTAVTDALGQYRFDDLPAGSYQLTAHHAEGYGGVTMLDLGPGETARLDLRLGTRQAALVLSLLWALMAVLIAAAFAASVILYGYSRRRDRSSGTRSLTVALVLWGFAFWLFSELSGEMQPMFPELAAGLSGILAALLAGVVVLVVVELRPPWPAAASAVCAGLLLSVAAHKGTIGPFFGHMGVGVGLLVWTTAAGWLLSLWVRKPSYLVLSAITIALCDFYSVFHGPTGAIASGGHPELLELGALPWPILGTRTVQGVIGLGDFLFLAWFLAAAQKFEYGLVRNFWALMGAFTIGIIMAQVLSLTGLIQVGLPALPFLSAMFLLVNRTRFEISADDQRHIVRFVAVLIVVLLLLVKVQSRKQRETPEKLEVTPAVSTAPKVKVPWADAPALTGKVSLGTPMAHTGPPGFVGWQVTSTDGWRGWLTVRDKSGPREPAFLILASPLDRPDAGLAAAAGMRTGYFIEDQRPCLVVDWSLPADADVDGLVFNVTPGPDRSLLYHAGRVAAAAARFLRAQPWCNGDLVVFGRDWGAVPAMGLALTDPHVTALVLSEAGAADGAGQAPAALKAQSRPTRERFLAAYSPVAYAAALRVPTSVWAGTNNTRFELPAAVKLYEALPRSRRSLVLQPNHDQRTVSDLAPGQPPWNHAQAVTRRADAAPVIATAKGDRLTLHAKGATDAYKAEFYLSTSTSPWPGRWWSRIPASRVDDGWQTTVQIASPARSVSILARYGAYLGHQVVSAWSPPVEVEPASIGLALMPPPWPETLVAPTGEDGGYWAVLAPRQDCNQATLLMPAAHGWSVQPPYLPPGPWRHVDLLTHQVDNLRRLGGQADGLRLRLDAARNVSPERWRLCLIERYAQPDERRFVAKFSPLAGAQTIDVPLRSFHGPPGSARILWNDVDTVLLSLDADPRHPPTLEEIRLYGPTGAIRSVEP